MSKIKIIRRKLFNNNFVFIDGISKSGKIVISSIISSFQNCENQTMQDKFNNYLKFNNLKLLDEDLAIDLILHNMQIFTIECQLSRFLNFRKYDLSSVNNSFIKKKYYNRLKINDNPEEIEKIIKNLKKKKKLIPCVVDDFFPNCKNKFKYFYKFNKIILLRNPLGVLHDYLKRDFLNKLSKGHPWQTVFHYKKNNQKIPWYVKQKDSAKYLSKNKIDKHLMYLKTEYEPYLKKEIFKIPNTKFIFLEDVWKYPTLITKHLENFIKTKKTRYTKKILKKLNLPRLNIEKQYNKEFNYLKNIMNEKQFKVILKIEKKYFDKYHTYGIKIY